MHTFDAITAAARFIGKGKDQTLASVDKFFRSASGRVDVMSPGGAIYW